MTTSTATNEHDSSTETTTVELSTAGARLMAAEDASVSDLEGGEVHERDFASMPEVCCPITKLPFQDGVVHPKDGLTYERKAIEERERTSTHTENECTSMEFYPNRALMEYLDPSTNPRNEVQTGTTERGIFVCPITHDLLRDPVIDSEGNTFERAAIVGWILRHGVSPITRKPLQVDQLYDNTTLLMVLRQEIQRQTDQGFLREDDEDIASWKRDLLNPPKVPMIRRENNTESPRWRELEPPASPQQMEEQRRIRRRRTIEHTLVVLIFVLGFIGMKALIFLNTFAGLVGLLVLLLVAGTWVTFALRHNETTT